MRLHLVAVLAAACLGSAAASQIFGLQYKCSGFLCKDMEVNVVHINPISGTVQLLANFVPAAKKESVEPLTALTAYNPATRTYYSVFTDTMNNVNTLYSYSNATGAITKAEVPYFIANVNISAVAYDTKFDRLIASYGASLVSLDVKTGNATTILQLFDPSAYYTGNVATYDPYNVRFLITVYPATFNDCYYIYVADLTSNTVTPTPCMASPAENPGNLDATAIVPYNGTGYGYVTLWTNILGGNLNFYDPFTQKTSGIFGPSDFAGWDWFLQPEAFTTTYDPVSTTFWMFCQDDNDNEFMGGVACDSKKGTQGANFQSNADDVRNFQFMY